MADVADVADVTYVANVADMATFTVPLCMKQVKIKIKIRRNPELDPVLPDLDPAKSGTGSVLAGSRSGKIRIWIRFGRI